MLENIVQDITFQFLKRKIIDNDEIDIFMYGLEAILTSLIAVIKYFVTKRGWRNDRNMYM